MGRKKIYGIGCRDGSDGKVLAIGEGIETWVVVIGMEDRDGNDR